MRLLYFYILLHIAIFQELNFSDKVQRF